MRATVRVPVVRSGASVEAGQARWRAEREGSRFRPGHVLVDDAGGRALARLRREGRRSLFEVGGRSGDWRKLGRDEGHGAVEPDGTVFAAARVRSGWRTVGTVEVGEALGDEDALAAAVLAAYLAIRKVEEDSAVAVVV